METLTDQLHVKDPNKAARFVPLAAADTHVNAGQCATGAMAALVEEVFAALAPGPSAAVLDWWLHCWAGRGGGYSYRLEDYDLPEDVRAHMDRVREARGHSSLPPLLGDFLLKERTVALDRLAEWEAYPRADIRAERDVWNEFVIEHVEAQVKQGRKGNDLGALPEDLIADAEHFAETQTNMKVPSSTWTQMRKRLGEVSVLSEIASHAVARLGTNRPNPSPPWDGPLPDLPDDGNALEVTGPWLRLDPPEPTNIPTGALDELAARVRGAAATRVVNAYSAIDRSPPGAVADHVAATSELRDELAGLVEEGGEHLDPDDEGLVELLLEDGDLDAARQRLTLMQATVDRSNARALLDDLRDSPWSDVAAAAATIDPNGDAIVAQVDDLAGRETAANADQVRKLRRLVERTEATTGAVDDEERRQLLDDLKDVPEAADTTGLEKRVGQLEEEARAVGKRAALQRRRTELLSNDDPEIVAAAEAINLMSEGAEDQLERLEERAATALAQRARDILEQLQRLGVPAQLFADARTAVDRNEVTPGTLEDLEGQLEQATRAARERARNSLEAARAALDDTRVVTGVGEEIGGLLNDAEAAMATDPAGAERVIRAARDRLDRQTARLWGAEKGEAKLIEHVEKYVDNVGNFDPVDVRRLHTVMKSHRPFAVLAGVTGSGKSSLARAYAEAIGCTRSNGRLVHVPVRPNWLDANDTLGYVNPTTNRFEPGWFALALRSAARDPDLPLVIILDEMNLAPIEQYLGDWLSVSEELAAGAESVPIVLYPPGTEPDNADQWPPTIELGRNVRTIGTVNMDESTRALTPRVLDRAAVIQLALPHATDHHEDKKAGDVEPSWTVRHSDLSAIAADAPDGRFHDRLVSVSETLVTAGIGLGARAHLAVEWFVANSEGLLDPDDAFDIALLQQVIPKVRGFKADLVTMLEELATHLEEWRTPRTAAVVDKWLDVRLTEDAFLDGADETVGLV